MELLKRGKLNFKYLMFQKFKFQACLFFYIHALLYFIIPQYKIKNFVNLNVTLNQTLISYENRN